MTESLIRIETAKIDGELAQSVNARVLHKSLASKKKFTHWIQQQLKLFSKGRDYVILGDLEVTKKSHGHIKNEYFLTLDTAKHIAMMSRTKRGKELRQYFIDVEKNYKRMLAQQATQSWQAIRSGGKVVRLQVTDAINDLVEHAESQGSKNARKRYYSNITNMEYNSLFFVADALPKPNKIRDMLDELQLSNLATAEGLIAQVIKSGISDNLPYKEIYQLCKKEIEKFVKLIGKSTILAEDSMLGHNSRHMIEEEDAATSPSELESLKNQPSGA